MIKASGAWGGVLAVAAALGWAWPAAAQENLVGLDYFETTSTRLLAPGAARARYGLSLLETRLGAPANQLTLAWGLADTLMIGAGLQTGGENASGPVVPSYQVGMVYAPDEALAGWTPALQLQYQGGFNQALTARGVASFDAPVVALNGVTDRLNLSANLLAEAPFRDGGELALRYHLGASYPLWGQPAAEPAGAPTVRALQRRPAPKLRAALELKGDLAAAGGHYAVPGLFMSPGESVQWGLGVGLRLAGADKPLYLQTQLQVGF